MEMEIIRRVVLFLIAGICIFTGFFCTKIVRDKYAEEQKETSDTSGKRMQQLILCMALVTVAFVLAKLMIL